MTIINRTLQTIIFYIWPVLLKSVSRALVWGLFSFLSLSYPCVYIYHGLHPWTENQTDRGGGGLGAWACNILDFSPGDKDSSAQLDKRSKQHHVLLCVSYHLIIPFFSICLVRYLCPALSLRPWSIFWLSRAIGSIVTGNQWSGPVKSVLKWFHWSALLVSRSNWSDRTTG